MVNNKCGGWRWYNINHPSTGNYRNTHAGIPYESGSLTFSLGVLTSVKKVRSLVFCLKSAVYPLP